MADKPDPLDSVDKFYNNSLVNETAASNTAKSETATPAPNRPADAAVSIRTIVQSGKDNEQTSNVDNVDPVDDDQNSDRPNSDNDSNSDSKASDETNEETIVQYLELDGKEYDLEDVRKWQSGHMMQKDYTKKTMALAEDRKKFKAESTLQRDALISEQAKMSDMKTQLSALVIEDDAIDWSELKENDPEEYINLKEKADKRKALIDKIKAEAQTLPDDPAMIEQEKAKLFAANPDWIDSDNEPTESFNRDITLINDYAARAGFSSEEFSQMTRSHHMITVLKAAKYDALQEKTHKIKQRRENVPLVTKPKAAKQTSEPKSFADVFYGSG